MRKSKVMTGAVSMKILVACEESGMVINSFRKFGYTNVWSCDILPTSGGFPEWHIQADVLEHLNNDWNMIIAFPPCTYLTNVANRGYSLKCNSFEKVEARKQKRIKAFQFFMLFANSNCGKIAIENPVGWVNSQWRKPDQIIHPYFFGDNTKKRTCLWLKGLPKLKPTNMLPEPEAKYISKGEKTKGKKIGWCEGISGCGGQEGRSKARGRTFPGIADAMAKQWGKYCESDK